MRTLLLSAILYLLGISGILLLRPSIMFHSNGDWKEFGTISSEHTIFPFWMFCIAWAVISYIVTLLLLQEYTSAIAVAAAVTTPALTEIEPIPVKPRPKKKSNGVVQPGYYILKGSDDSGPPEYVYYGDKPPPIIRDEEEG